MSIPTLPVVHFILNIQQQGFGKFLILGLCSKMNYSIGLL